MTDLHDLEWVVKPTKAYITHFPHESVAMGREEYVHKWEDFYRLVLTKPVVMAAKHFVEDAKIGKRKLSRFVHKGYSLTRYKEHRRRAENVVELYAVAIDLDHKALSVEELEHALRELGVACFWHTTLSHGCGGRSSFRILFPFEEACADVNVWNRTRSRLASWFAKRGREFVPDENPKSAGQFWYWPACVRLEDYGLGVVDGEFVNLSDAPRNAPLPAPPPPSNRTFGSGAPLLSLSWLDRKLHDYASLTHGRGEWLGRRALLWGGLYAAGRFEPGLSETAIEDTVIAKVMQNSGRSESDERKYFQRQWAHGLARPCTEGQPRARGGSMGTGKLEIVRETSHTQGENTEPKNTGRRTPIDVGQGIVELQLTKGFKVKKNYENYSRLFGASEIGKRVAWDELSYEVVVREETGDRPYEELCDAAAINRWIATVGETFDWPDIPKSQFLMIMTEHANRHAFNSEQERFESAGVEGAVAAEDVAVDILKTEGTALNRATIAYGLFATVARAISPVPTEVHGVPILEGFGGIGKTQFLKILGGPRYKCHQGPLVAEQHMLIATTGTMVLELGELFALIRTDHEQAKSFITISTDILELKFLNNPVKRIRRFTLWGTTNCLDNYLPQDRRYLPVRCGVIDPEGLHAQGKAVVELTRWAECVDATLALVYRRIQEGFEWWNMLEPFKEQLDEVRKDRQSEVPFMGLVQANFHRAVAHDSFGLPTTDEIMETCGIDIAHWTRLRKEFVGAIRTLGFVSKLKKVGGNVKRGWAVPDAS